MSKELDGEWHGGGRGSSGSAGGREEGPRENPIQILLGHILANTLTYAGVLEGPRASPAPTACTARHSPSGGGARAHERRIFSVDLDLYADVASPDKVGKSSLVALTCLDPFFKIQGISRNYLTRI